MKLKDGSEFVDKFIERRPRDVVFEGRTVPAADIQSFSIYPLSAEMNRPTRPPRDAEQIVAALTDAGLEADSRTVKKIVAQVKKVRRRKAA